MRSASKLAVLVLVALASLMFGATAPAPASAAFPTHEFSPGRDLPSCFVAATAITLLDGRVMMAGEHTGCVGMPTGSWPVLLFDPVTVTWSQLPLPPPVPAFTQLGGATLTRLQDGRVLVAGGGYFGSGARTHAWTFDPTTNALTSAAPMNEARAFHGANLLPDGSVLVTGGWNGPDPTFTRLQTSERYDPAANTWTPAAPMSRARGDHGAVSLPDGDVLVIMGAFPADSERYDAATDSWMAPAAVSGVASGDTPVVLASGLILVEGGISSKAAALYDPTTNAWSPAANMITNHGGHSATKLLSGQALVAGDTFGGRSEIYDPVLNQWHVVDRMPRLISRQGAALLQDGTVLLIAGDVPGGNSRFVDTYGPDGDGDGYNDLYERQLGENGSLFCRTMRADVNFDNIVNSGDLGRVASQYYFMPVNRRHDQNGDNIVNSGDFGLMASRFNQLASNCL